MDSMPDSPVERVLCRLENVRQTRAGSTARCPAHDDRKNSLSISVGDDGRVLLRCFAGCHVERIAEALGLSLRDLFPRQQHRARRRHRITLEELARDKGLPVNFLRDLGLEDYGEGVRIPYRLENGSLAPRQRIRTALAAKAGSFWSKGNGSPVPYGLWRLDEARDAGFQVLPEGESDCWTLWYHGFPALGIPGASMTSKLELSHLAGIKRAYICREPGASGATFVTGAAQRLQEIGWTGDMYILTLLGIKDPNDLHKCDPNGFKTAFQSAMEAAEPLTKTPGAISGVAALTKVPYQATHSGLLWLKPTRDGHVSVPLTNFTAGIVGEVAEDDGAEVRRTFEIEATLNGRTSRFSVSAAQFTGMSWPLEHLGASAIVLPGFSVRDHARAAVQLLSGDVPRRTAFAHTGWRKLGDAWVYLHAGGAIGANGPVAGVEVALPESLSPFVLPQVPANEELIAACRSSLRLLDVVVDAVSVPLCASIWRAVLAIADFSEHLAGATGFFKTELATLAMQHFGAGFDARHLPANWSSTGNSLEGLAFIAKDALLVIDDFAPTGSTADVQRYHREADRVLRAQGNNAGRQRMRPDATLKPSKPPRGLIISTGEDVPRGQSLRARVLVLEIGPNDVNQQLLTKAQADAAKGVYAQLMAGYLQWLAPRYDAVRQNLRSHGTNLRLEATSSASHRRTPEIVANLMFGLECFLDFAKEIGAVTKAEATKIWQRCWAGLGKAASAQAEHHRASEPVRRFFELLNAALASGRAHVAGAEGREPPQAEAWGWREVIVGAGDNARVEWRPQGERVGWLDGEDLFLDLDAAYAAAQTVGYKFGDSLTLTPRTLSKRLYERGLLRSTDTESRETFKVRRTLEGRRREALHLAAALLAKCTFSEINQDKSGAWEGAPEATTWAPAQPTSDVLPSTNPTILSPVDEASPRHVVGLVGSDEGEKANEGQDDPDDRERPGSPSAHAEPDKQPYLQLENPTNLTRAEAEEEFSGEDLV